MRAAPRRRTLNITAPQIAAIRRHVECGLANAAALLVDSHAPDSGTHLREVACCALGDFASGALRADDDLIAGVAVRFDGSFSGSALLAMDPQNALDWTRAGGDSGDPLAVYVEQGSRLLSALIGGASAEIGAVITAECPRLCEEPVASILLGTHAPTETVVISVLFDLAAGDVVVPAYSYAMLEPKVLSGLLGTLLDS